MKHAPNDPQLTTKLNAWRADADANRGFVESRVDRFRVSFQGHADKALAARATDLARVSVLANWKNTRRVSLGPGRGDALHRGAVPRRDAGAGVAGGLYDGRIRVPAAGAAQSPQLFERVLAHELTHAMIANLAPRGIPAWLHEGLAQYFEGDDPAVARRRLKAVGLVIPLRHLEQGFSRLHRGPGAGRLRPEPGRRGLAILQRANMDWNSLFRALTASSRTDDTFDNFGLRYSELEGDVERRDLRLQRHHGHGEPILIGGRILAMAPDGR